MGLDNVKRWMTFYGWKNGGAPGSTKVIHGYSVVAQYGDATWIKDVEEACRQDERDQIVAEIERRK